MEQKILSRRTLILLFSTLFLFMQTAVGSESKPTKLTEIKAVSIDCLCMQEKNKIKKRFLEYQRKLCKQKRRYISDVYALCSLLDGGNKERKFASKVLVYLWDPVDFLIKAGPKLSDKWLEVLKKEGLSVNKTNRSGTCLLAAYVKTWQHPKVVKWLLKNGADVNQQDDVHHTPTIFAGCYNPSCMKVLLEHKPNIFQHNIFGKTVLHEFASCFRKAKDDEKKLWLETIKMTIDYAKNKVLHEWDLPFKAIRKWLKHAWLFEEEDPSSLWERKLDILVMAYYQSIFKAKDALKRTPLCILRSYQKNNLSDGILKDAINCMENAEWYIGNTPTYR